MRKSIKRFSKISNITFLLISALLVMTPINVLAATDHSGGNLRTTWNPFPLQNSESLELPFMPINIEGLVDNNKDKWTTFYNFGFDWRSGDVLSPNPLTGYIQIGLYRRTGSIYFGNLDFFIANATEVRKNPSDSTSICELDPWSTVRIRNVNKTQTRTAICWRAIQITPGAIYSFNLKPDRSLGSGWWYASLTNNLNSNESIVGSIKVYSPSNVLDFSNFTFNRNYTGESTSCDAVPISDTYVWPIRKSTGESSKYLTNRSDSCVETAVDFDSAKGAYAIKYGGNNPTSRLKSNSSSAKPESSLTDGKPSTPTFSAVNFVGNTLNVSVNLGTVANARPDKVFLVAPKIGITSDRALEGDISGSTARWSITFDKAIIGTMIPLEIMGEKNGVKSETLVGAYQAPTVTVDVTSPPKTPRNLKSRVIGNSAVITVDISMVLKSRTQTVLLFSPTLGISKSKAISAELVADKAVFEIPIKNAMFGKKFPVTIFAANKVGESKPLSDILSIPAIPKTSQITIPNPRPSTPATVICIRSTQTRTFSGMKCPPGWVLP